MRLLYQPQLADVYGKKNGKMEVPVFSNVLPDQQSGVFSTLGSSGKGGSGQSRVERRSGFSGGKDRKVQGVKIT